MFAPCSEAQFFGSLSCNVSQGSRTEVVKKLSYSIVTPPCSISPLPSPPLQPRPLEELQSALSKTQVWRHQLRSQKVRHLLRYTQHSYQTLTRTTLLRRLQLPLLLLLSSQINEIPNNPIVPFKAKACYQILLPHPATSVQFPQQIIASKWSVPRNIVFR